MMKYITYSSLIVALIYLIASPLVWSGETKAEQTLPGYYEFFMKTGKFQTLEAEVKQNQEIQSGKIIPITVGKPVEDIQLPDASGKKISPRDFIGSKNVAMITGRAWW